MKWTIGNPERVEERVREEDGQAGQREESEEEEEGRSDNTPTAYSTGRARRNVRRVLGPRPPSA